MQKDRQLFINLVLLFISVFQCIFLVLSLPELIQSPSQHALALMLTQAIEAIQNSEVFFFWHDLDGYQHF